MTITRYFNNPSEKTYSFICGMPGENQSFSDMDFVEIKNLK